MATEVSVLKGDGTNTYYSTYAAARAAMYYRP